jgi:hypothetical protein
MDCGWGGVKVGKWEGWTGGLADRQTVKADPSHLFRGQFCRALTELYLLRLTRRLRTAFWTPSANSTRPLLGKLELLETLFGVPMADER